MGSTRAPALTLSLGLLAALAAGCGGGRAEKEARAAASWAASARMAAEAWQTSAAPRIFVIQVLETAARTLDEQRQDIEGRSRSAQTQSAALQRLRVVRDAVVVARDAVQRSDRPQLHAALQTLEREETALLRSAGRGTSS